MLNFSGVFKGDGALIHLDIWERKVSPITAAVDNIFFFFFQMKQVLTFYVNHLPNQADDSHEFQGLFALKIINDNKIFKNWSAINFVELDMIQAAKKKEKDRKKKQKTPVVGDIGVLADTLPTIDLLLKGETGPKANRYKT